MRSILPADTYIVFNKAFIENKEKDILVSLYQPIIGITAINLYLTLTNDLMGDNIESERLTHQHLMNLMLTNLDTIVEARERLEAIGLLKTFYRSDTINNYIYVLYAPLSANEFLNHPILNVVLYNNLGKMEYEMVVNKYKTKRVVTKDYEDITASFDKVFTPVNGYNYENPDIIDDKTRRLEIKGNVDINLIISGIPNRMTSPKCFNKDTVNLIVSLAYLYKIDNINMQGLVRNAINEKGLIDKDELTNAARNFYQFENNGKLPTLIYNKQPDYLKEPTGSNTKLSQIIYTFENISPIELLKKLYNNAEPTIRDKKIIDSLMINQKLPAGVVNVLIDYALKVNNMKLNKDFVEAIAGQWKRLNIETVKEAMDICRKEHKKITKQIPVKKETKNIKDKQELPEWLDKDIEENKENIDELVEILKDFD